MPKPARIIQTAPTRSPARQALAAAIRERDECHTRVAEAREALERAIGMVTATEQALVSARQAARASRDQHAERIAAAATTGAPLPVDETVRQLRIVECDAQDQHGAAQKAVEISRAALSAVPASLASAERGVTAAADDVIDAVDANALLDRMEQVQTELMALRLQHRYFRGNHLYADKDTAKRGERLCCWEFAGVYGQPEYQEFDRHPRFIDWTNAHARLQANADAALPGEPGHQPLPLNPDPDTARDAENVHVRAAAMRLHEAQAAE